MNLDHNSNTGPGQNDLANPPLGGSAGVPKYNQGTVYKKSTGSYDVYASGRMVPCELSTRLRKQLIYPTADPHSLRPIVREVKAIEHYDPVAVGDQVRFIDAQDGRGLIIEVLPRRSKLTRRTAVPMPTAHPFEQVIAANVDQVVPVFAAANPTPKWNMLDRYLVSAESLDLPSLICINKLDLAQDSHGVIDGELSQTVAEYRQIGYPVVLVSAFTGQGLDELKEALKGRISAFVGKSGVGKTSLLNALQPGLGLRVREVSQATGKGKHATTRLEMFQLEFGDDAGTAGDEYVAAGNHTAIVDTPGVREFGLWELGEDDLALFFPEMRPYVGRCKFGLDCRHNEEPGCAIRKAVLDGKIGPRRYKSYQQLRVDP
jgi:ribosome biogenesis GTPase / thiamine phosphate phosphatase